MGHIVTRINCVRISALSLLLMLITHSCPAGETLLSGFEGDLSTSLELDWQSFANSYEFVSTGATQGSQALALTTPRTQNIPLRLFGGLDKIYATFLENTQLRADFTLPATADYREAFFRLQINGGAFTIDGDDMILSPGETVTGIWDYEAEGVFETLELIGQITAFSLQLGVRGPDIGNPPTSITIVDNIRWYSDVTQVAPGDFDGDGDVDGRDFLAWQRGESPDPLSSADLTLWQDNYGTVPTLVASSVPEPGSCLLILISVGLISSRRVRSY